MRYFENKNQEFLVTLKLKAALSFVILLCPTYKRQLRHIPQACNYMTFSKVSTRNLIWQAISSSDISD